MNKKEHIDYTRLQIGKRVLSDIELLKKDETIYELEKEIEKLKTQIYTLKNKLKDKK